MEVPLKRGVERSLPPELLATLDQEYASAYLEKIGAFPSAANKEFVLNNFPLSGALIVPVWPKDTLVIVPNMTEKEANATQLLPQLLSGKAVSNSLSSKKTTNKSKKQIFHNNPRINIDVINEKKEVFSSENALLRNTQKGRRVSWCTVHTLKIYDTLIDKLGVDEILSAPFKLMMKPLNFDVDKLLKVLSIYSASIVDYTPSVRKDPTGKLFDKIKNIIAMPSSIKLYGILAHYCYWNVIHPCVRRTLLLASNNGYKVNETSPKKDDDMSAGGISISSKTSLSNDEREELFVQLEVCFAGISTDQGFNKFALTTCNQGLVGAAHFVVDGLLTAVYPWLLSRYDSLDVTTGRLHAPLNAKDSAISRLRLQMRRLVHQTIADIVDPSRVYTSALLISSLVGEHEKVRDESSSRINYFCTSVATRAVFGDAKNHDTRRLLALSGPTPYVPIPGLVHTRLNRKHDDSEYEELQRIMMRRQRENGFDKDSVCATRKTIPLPQDFEAASLVVPASTTKMLHLAAQHFYSAELRNGDNGLLKQLRYARSLRSRSNEGVRDDILEDMTRVHARTEAQKEEHKVALDFKNLFGANSGARVSDKRMSRRDDSDNEFDDEDGEDVRSIEMDSVNSSQSSSQDSISDSSRSVAKNKNAALQLSLKAKGKLMAMLTARAASHYNKRNISLYGKVLNANYREELLTMKNGLRRRGKEKNIIDAIVDKREFLVKNKRFDEIEPRF